MYSKINNLNFVKIRCLHLQHYKKRLTLCGMSMKLDVCFKMAEV